MDEKSLKEIEEDIIDAFEQSPFIDNSQLAPIKITKLMLYTEQWEDLVEWSKSL